MITMLDEVLSSEIDRAKQLCRAYSLTSIGLIERLVIESGTRMRCTPMIRDRSLVPVLTPTRFSGLVSVGGHFTWASLVDWKSVVNRLQKNDPSFLFENKTVTRLKHCMRSHRIRRTPNCAACSPVYRFGQAVQSG